MNLAFILLTALASAAHAQAPAAKPAVDPTVAANTQKARQALERTIQALGGRAYLDYFDVRQEGRTNRYYRGSPAGVGAPFRRYWKAPDKERIEFFKRGDWKIIHNGDQGFDITYHGTRREDASDLADYMRRRDHSLDNALRRWLQEPGVMLFHEGLSLAERKQVEKVSLLNAHNQSVTLYLDTSTHLPVKTTYSFRDPKTRETIEEGEIFDNYRMVQGIQTAHNLLRTRNGEIVNQRFLKSVSYNNGMADSMFTAVVNYVPKTGSTEQRPPH